MQRIRLAGLAAAALAVVTALGVSQSALAGEDHAAAGDAYSATTSVGVHNAYEQDKYPYFADALDSGASLLEVDVWTNVVGGPFRVAHDSPVSNQSNCENARSADELRTKSRDQDLAGCLSDMKAWHDAHPDHRPIFVKVEMKDGFYDKGDRGPDEFDALINDKLGDAVFRPSDLIGDAATLDEAVTANGWPSRDALAGKFVFDLIPGTVEKANPFDTLWTDREYATYLRDLKSAGDLAQATAFPVVLGAESGDPRTTRYTDASIRPWFVVFDGAASKYADGSIDTAWYDRNHYLLITTDAQSVPPAIDGTNPSEADARARVDLLAKKHASILTADWYPLPSVLSTVVPRG